MGVTSESHERDYAQDLEAIQEFRATVWDHAGWRMQSDGQFESVSVLPSARIYNKGDTLGLKQGTRSGSANQIRIL